MPIALAATENKPKMELQKSMFSDFAIHFVREQEKDRAKLVKMLWEMSLPNNKFLVKTKI